MIDQTFGDMVYHEDPQQSLEEFPSPAELQNKILISRRPPTKLLYAKAVENGVELEIQEGSTDKNYQSVVGFHAVEPRGMLQKALTDDVQQPGWYERDVIRYC